MLKPGSAQKVTVYIGEDVRYRGEPLYIVVLNYLFYHGVSGATVTKGVAGFGAGRHMHTARILEVSENLPMKIEFVETPPKLDELLPKLLQMVGDGLVEIQDTTILKAATASEAEPLLPRVALSGKATMMRIFIGEDDRWHGKRLFEAIVEALRANDIAGVTVYRGILGYGANRRFHKEKRMSLSNDRPIMLSVIDQDAKIRAFLPRLESMVREGLVALSDVQVIKYAHRPGATIESSKEGQ
jgi:PII-like signaling protein